MMLTRRKRAFIPILSGHLLLFFCCLFFLCASMSTHAQTSAAQLQWTQANYYGLMAYSPTDSLIAVSQGFDEIALLHPDGTVAQTIDTRQKYVNCLAFTHGWADAGHRQYLW